MWYVLYDFVGVIVQVGGVVLVVKWFDMFFMYLNIGIEQLYFYVGNEVMMVVLWVYVWVGVLLYMQCVLYVLFVNVFGFGVVGLFGNDDFGVLFGWYVWVVFGFYLVVLGVSGVVLLSLQFEVIMVCVGQQDGSYWLLYIVVLGVGLGDSVLFYVKLLKLNGMLWFVVWLLFEYIVKGGKLMYVMMVDVSVVMWGVDVFVMLLFLWVVGV